MNRRSMLLVSLLLLALAPGCEIRTRAEVGRTSPTVGASTGAAIATSDLVQHSVDSDGHAMAVWEKSPQGASAAETPATVLLLHGRTWSTVPDFDLQVDGEDLSLMEGLVAEGFVTYGLDARGYGGTPRDSSGWLTPNRAAADVINVLEWIASVRPADEPLYVFGWSYGSMVAQLTVQQRPDLVDGLILFGYPYRPDSQSSEPREYPEDPPRTATTAEGAASDFIVPGSISTAAIDAYVASALAADPIRADWKNLHEWSALSPEAVTVPVLLLQGEHDPLAPTESQAEFFSRVGTADREWVTVPGGDHASFLETPRPYFLDALVGFLNRSRGG